MKSRLTPSNVLRSLRGIAVAYVALLLVLVSLEDRLIFNPKRASERWVEPSPGWKFADLELRTHDGMGIHARWFPCPNARGAVLICHSRAANLSLALMPHDVAEWHRETGLSLLIFDYPRLRQE
jgi:hypothetical protein